MHGWELITFIVTVTVIVLSILAYAWASTQLLVGDPARYEEPGLYEEVDLEASSGARRDPPSYVLAFAELTPVNGLAGSGSGEPTPGAPSS